MNVFYFSSAALSGVSLSSSDQWDKVWESHVIIANDIPSYVIVYYSDRFIFNIFKTFASFLLPGEARFWRPDTQSPLSNKLTTRNESACSE